jgi:hypothetical protein
MTKWKKKNWKRRNRRRKMRILRIVTWGMYRCTVINNHSLQMNLSLKWLLRNGRR